MRDPCLMFKSRTVCSSRVVHFDVRTKRNTLEEGRPQSTKGVDCFSSAQSGRDDDIEKWSMFGDNTEEAYQLTENGAFLWESGTRFVLWFGWLLW